MGRISRLLAATSVAAIIGMVPRPAHSQMTATQLEALIASNVPSGQPALMTAASLRQVLDAMVASTNVAATACPGASVLSPYQLFSNTLGAPTNIEIQVFDGATCVSIGSLNSSTHSFVGAISGITSNHLLTSIAGAAGDSNIFGATNTGASNLSVGVNVFNPNNGQVSNLNNTAFGVDALAAMTNSPNNTAIGWEALTALAANVGGNTALGALAGNGITTGPNNTAIGSATSRYQTTGDGNTALGHGALAGDDFTPATNTGRYNSALGAWSMQEITTGALNTAVGVNAGLDLTTGIDNTFVGVSAGACTFNLTATAIGCGASYNTGVGTQALQQNQADFNSAFGFNALQYNTTGTQNTALGFQTLNFSLVDLNNTAVGYASMATLNGGSNNTAVGANTLLVSTTGQYNTALGTSSLVADTTGSFNTAAGVGALAGNTTGVQNVAFGVSATSTGNFSNTVAIGYGSQPTGSNQVVIGNLATVSNQIYGNLQIDGNYICFGTSTCSASNFSVYGDGTNSIFHALSAGVFNFQLSATTYVQLSTVSLSVLNATAATSTTTGGLTVVGGLGVGGKAYFGAPVNLPGYAIASLPSGVLGDTAYVTDQLTTCAVIGAALTPGGSAKCPAFFNGSAWVGG